MDIEKDIKNSLRNAQLLSKGMDMVYNSIVGYDGRDEDRDDETKEANSK